MERETESKMKREVVKEVLEIVLDLLYNNIGMYDFLQMLIEISELYLTNYRNGCYNEKGVKK